MSKDLQSMFPPKASGELLRGVIEKIPYLKALGINGVELMPVYDFDAENPEDSAGRRNYWGYGPAHFMAVKPEYGAEPEKAGEGLKRLVQAMHREGIEVYMELFFYREGNGRFSDGLSAPVGSRLSYRWFSFESDGHPTPGCFGGRIVGSD